MFKTTASIGLVLALGLVLVAGCGGPAEIKVDASNRGERIELGTGEVLVVRLESNPTTGYQWAVQELDESVLQQQGESVYESSGGRNPPPGTGGWETFRFAAVAPGETRLEMIYHQPWVEGDSHIGTFSLRVVVTGQ